MCYSFEGLFRIFLCWLAWVGGWLALKGGRELVGFEASRPVNE